MNREEIDELMRENGIVVVGDAVYALVQLVIDREREACAKVWDEGYRAGINDERISEDNIGIAGFGAKVEPARNNPYRTRQQPPIVSRAEEAYEAAKQREWVGLTDEEIDEAERLAHIRHQKHMYSIRGQQITPADNPQWHYARAIEAKSKEKNT